MRRVAAVNIGLANISYLYMGHRMEQALESGNYDAVRAIAFYAVAIAVVDEQLSRRVERFREKY